MRGKDWRRFMQNGEGENRSDVHLVLLCLRAAFSFVM